MMRLDMNGPDIDEEQPSSSEPPAINRARLPGESAADTKNRISKETRDYLRAAGKCICGPLVGNVSRSGFEHGPPVDKSGRCQHCHDTRKNGDQR